MNSKTILRNTVWYGVENAISFVASLVTSIAIARTLGPTRMGYVIYVIWIANIAGSLGSIGIPATTRKYMAEFIGGGDPATARFIYMRTLWIQALTATVVTAGCVIWVLRTAPPGYVLASLLLVLSVWPTMANSVSAQANVAREDLSANVPASAAATLTFFLLIVGTLVFHWGVVGVGAALLGMRCADFGIRLGPTFLRIRRSSPESALPAVDLRRRMLRFALQSMMSMALTLIVWDRSEIFLLRHLSSDIRQISFYSVAFNLAEKLLIFPTVFASATGVSVYAQYGRDRTKIPALTAAATRYLALTSIPLHVIASALAGAMLLVLYGKAYAGAVAVCMAAPLLCLPKAFLTPVQTLFEAVERQQYFLWATVVASAIDVAVAWMLIPRYGALGAALGSGAAQVLAISVLWVLAVRKYQVRLPWAFLRRITGITLTAAATALLIVRLTPPLVGVIAGSIAAIAVFLALAVFLRVFEHEDLARFRVIVESCPAAFAAPVNLTYSWISRRMAPAITEELP